MKKLLSLCLTVAGLNTFAGSETNSPASPAPPAATFTYVLVHGAWGGGWDWKHIDQLLTADGHTVYRPTLSGLGEHSNFNSTNIDLATHIQDIVNVILWEDLHDVVLVGHSYGGMVITGVADRIPDRIKHVVYVDAKLPENGEFSDSIMAKGEVRAIKDGFLIPFWVNGNPPPPHDVPMSALTYTQPIVLTNQVVAQKLPTTYILTVDAGRTPQQDEFFPYAKRAQARNWAVVIIEGDHNVQRSHPRELVKLLEQAP